MPDSFDDSIRIYYSQADPDEQASSFQSSHHHHDAGAILQKLINNVLEDMKTMGRLHASLHESNELVKVAPDASTMANLRNRLNADFQCLLDLAKQINKKFDSLVAANAAQRSAYGTSIDERTRTSMIADLADNIKVMMRDFQGLRAQMEIDHRQIIENRYSAITGEKATAEAIDRLIANKAGPGSDLYQAVAEIQVRRDTMMEARTNLMCLHQILLGISTPVEAGNQQQKQPPSSFHGEVQVSTPSSQSHVPNSFALGMGVGNGMGMGMGMGTVTAGLNDYERETRKQAQIAIIVAMVVMFLVILALFIQEYTFETMNEDLILPPP